MHSPEARTGNDDRWPEERLVTGIAAGQPEARAALVSASHDAVFSFACKLSPDRDLRRDWTHDCLLRIIADIESGAFELRHPGGFWSWFRKRAWFFMLEARRTHRRRRVREVSNETQGVEPASHATPLRDLELAEITAAVNDCLDGIDHEGQRNALRLLLLRDESYEEVAHELATPLNTVRAWIRRGRLELRRCLRRRLDLVSGRDGKS